MQLLMVTCLCIIDFYVRTEAAYFPQYITPCKIFDPDFQKCWVKSIENLRPYVTTGIKELKVPSSDPLHVSKLTVNKKHSNTAVYESYLKNIVISGGKNFQILNANFDPNSLLINLRIGFPKLKWSTNGYGHGIILGFALNGTFRSEFDFRNLVLDLVLDGEEYEVYGRRHIDWSLGSIEVTYDSVNLIVYDILKETYLLQAFNNAINQNAFLLADHIKPLIENSVGRHIIDIINRVHSTYSKDVLYPKY